jgi:3',5'-cyclic AMP phosphodiesterase CpdA
MDHLVLMHLSDLHMSDSLESSVLTVGSGQQGHDPQLCRLLATRSRHIAYKYKIKPDELRWIISGDLTRTGRNDEFRVVRDFLETPPPLCNLGRPQKPTLGIAPGRYLDVPGNHDHWNGWDESRLISQAIMNPPPAWNANLFPGTFRSTVWDNLNAPWTSSGNSFRLEIFGLDSNSGLANATANRTAMGSISDGEFATLEDSLKLSNDRAAEDNLPRLRAILCHHAFTTKPQNGTWKASPLAKDHSARLTDLAARYRVPAILTGHTHTEAFRKLEVRVERYGETSPRDCHVYEIRSPTALQGIANSQVQGFWVHWLFRPTADNDVIWRPFLYKLAAGRFHGQNFDDLKLP